jgi:transcriptional regulator with XRE-family HTH domain
MMYGGRIRQLRKEKGMTLRELSKALGIPFTTLGNYEREDREPSLETFQTIADFFGVSIDYLIGKEMIIEAIPKGDLRDIQELLNTGTPEFKRVVLSIFDRMYYLTSGELESQDKRILMLINEILNFILEIKYDSELIHPRITKDQKINPPLTAYEVATKFIKEKNIIDNYLNEIFEIYTTRNNMGNK